MTVASMKAILVEPTTDESVVVSRSKPSTPRLNNLASLLERVSCIYHLIQFKNNQIEVQALLDSGSKVNAITPVHAAKLSFKVQLTDIGAQKIDSSNLKTFGIVLAHF